MKPKSEVPQKEIPTANIIQSYLTLPVYCKILQNTPKYRKPVQRKMPKVPQYTANMIQPYLPVYRKIPQSTAKY